MVEINDFELAGYSPDEAAKLQNICNISGIEPGTIIGCLRAFVRYNPIEKLKIMMKGMSEHE